MPNSQITDLLSILGQFCNSLAPFTPFYSVITPFSQLNDVFISTSCPSPPGRAGPCSPSTPFYSAFTPLLPHSMLSSVASGRRLDAPYWSFAASRTEQLIPRRPLGSGAVLCPWTPLPGSNSANSVEEEDGHSLSGPFQTINLSLGHPKHQAALPRTAKLSLAPQWLSVL